nr:hypothetical protein [Tanacetum cinerariifolium]
LGVGLGRVASSQIVDGGYTTPPYVGSSDDQGGYDTYVDVTEHGIDSTNEVPDSAIRTLDVSPNLLPALNFATGVASCTDCDAKVAATAAATAAATVTPMPAAPTTVNWLLIAVGCGLGYALLASTSKPGLGCAPEPAPTPTVQQDLGRP